MRGSAADWQELSLLYERADGLVGEALRAFVAELRMSGHRLLPQLERMLAARRRADGDGFLLEPPALTRLVRDRGEGADDGIDAGEWSAGRRVGPYRLVRPLGSGGNAEVWLGERADDTFHREVAVKLPYRNLARNRRQAFAERFRRERDILAALQHPNIAALHDAGVTPEGQPWLALEVVIGSPLTDWCDARALDVRSRVRLFVQVLDAVAYAHANLVVHRDLKPANVLVTDGGNVKLLDFGIAKLVEDVGAAVDDSELTREAGGRPLTPQYASPEQLQGKPLTTASDVYTAGVVLHELLCGVRPAAGGRTLTGTLDPDLSAVVAKSLDELAARYPTANAMREDLDRWLNDVPVAARRPPLRHVVRKFVRRHRLAVGLASTGAAALVVFGAVVTSLWVDARRQSDRALATRDLAFEMFELADPDRSRGRALPARSVLEAGVRRADQVFASQPAQHAEVLSRIGVIQGDMGDYVAATEVLERAVALWKTAGDRKASVGIEIQLADLALRRDRSAEAATRLAAVAGAVDALGEPQLQARYASLRARSMAMDGDPKGGEVQARRALLLARQAWPPEHPRVIEALRELALVQRMNAAYGEAADHLAEASRLAGRGSPASPVISTGIEFEHAIVLDAAGRYAQAAALLDAATPRCERLLGPSAENCRAMRVLRTHLSLRLGDDRSPVAWLPQLRVDAQDAGNPIRRLEALGALYRVQAMTGSPDPATAEAVERVALGAAKESTTIRVRFVGLIAEAHLRAGRPEAAAKAIDVALQALASELARRPLQAARLEMLSGLSAQALGRHDAALTSFGVAMDLYRSALGPSHPLLAVYRLNEVASLRERGQGAAADRLLLEALPQVREAMGPASPVVGRAERLASPGRGTSSDFFL